MKLEKDGIIKNIENEKEQGDYVAAGWKVVKENETKSARESRVSFSRSREE